MIIQSRGLLHPVLLAIFSLCLWVGAGCRQSDPPVASALGGGADDDFVELSVDIPAVFSDDTSSLSHDFLICNDSNKAVKIGPVSKSCGCTTATLLKTSLLPGEKTQLHVEVDIRNRRGQSSVVVAVPSTGGKSWSCRVNYCVYDAISIMRDSLHLGQLAVSGGSGTVTLQLAALKSADFPRISRLSFHSGVANIVSQKDELDSNGVMIRTMAIDVSVPSNRVSADNSGNLEIAALDWNGAEITRSDLVTWAAPRIFEIEPRRAFFHPSSWDNLPQERRLIKITSIPGAPSPNVANIVSSHPAIKCSDVTVDNNGCRILQIEIDPSKASRTIVGNVSFDTLHTEHPKITIPVTVIKPHPVLP